MNTHLQQFASHYLRLVLAAAMPVFFVAFVSMPYSLGGHPGEPSLNPCLTCAPTLASRPASSLNT